MRTHIRRLAALMLFTALSACARGARSPSAAALQASAPLAITGVTLIDATGAPPAPGMTVLVEDGRIRAIARDGAARLPRGATVVDASGKYLIPGLWDAHVHLTFATEQALPLFVAHGVTSVRDVGSQIDEVRAMRRRVAAGALAGPRIRTSGPILESAEWMRRAYRIVPPDHPVWAAAPRVLVTGANAQSLVDSLVRAGVDLIKARNVYGAEFLALAAATERAGIPFASHNPNRVNMVDAARSGLDSFEHAESIWGDFDTLGVAARQRMFDAVAATHVLVAATMVTDLESNSPDSAILAAIADTAGSLDPRNRSLPLRMRANWREAVNQRRLIGRAPPGLTQRIAGGVRAMHRAGIPMLAGSDVGGVPLVYPGSSLHEELELLVRDGGLSPMEALQSATRNQSRFFGARDSTGTITVGRSADLVLLDADPLADIRNTRRIRAVVLGGRLLDRAALDALLGQTSPLRGAR